MRDERRRAGKQKERLKGVQKQTTGGEILKSYRKVGRLGSAWGRRRKGHSPQRSLSQTAIAPLPRDTCVQSHRPYPRSTRTAKHTEASWFPPGRYAPPGCRSAQDPEKTPARKASAPGAHGNEIHLPHAASALSAIPALARKTRATL